MILYPTETVYGLGVNALDSDEILKVYKLKGRSAEKMVSWLVRDISDIERYVILSKQARLIAETFLPGKITLVLPVRREVVPKSVLESDSIGMRISSDKNAQKLISEFMEEHNAPLTCTSANVSGQPTLATPDEILTQFGNLASMIDTVIDDGPRLGTPTTVVKVIGDKVDIIREGEVTRDMIVGVL